MKLAADRLDAEELEELYSAQTEVLDDGRSAGMAARCSRTPAASGSAGGAPCSPHLGRSSASTTRARALGGGFLLLHAVANRLRHMYQFLTGADGVEGGPLANPQLAVCASHLGQNDNHLAGLKSSALAASRGSRTMVMHILKEGRRTRSGD